MSKRKNVKIIVPTAHIKLTGLPPMIIIQKKFLQKNWKYILATWMIIIFVGYATSYLQYRLSLSWLSAPISGIILSIIPFYVGIYAISQHNIKEISR